MKPCTFCNKSIFEEQVIAETEYFYLIATLGQITDGGYLLIIPKRHVVRMADLKNPEFSNFAFLFTQAERALLYEYGTSVALFEHGGVGQTIPHAHLHVVPTDIDLAGKICADHPSNYYSRFNTPELFLQNAPSGPYLLWGGPHIPISNRENKQLDARRLLYIWVNPSSVVPQYFRIQLAHALGRPKRADWKKMDPQTDKKLWSETVQRLRPQFL